jgi:F0F1-type ATP synthase assembly protein I
MKNQKSKKRSLDNYARYSSIAFQMLFIILAGVFAGIKLDDLVNIRFPVFTIILSLGSVVLAIYYAIKDVIKKDDP